MKFDKTIINDIFVVLGLVGIGGGLWLYEPWISYTVTGFLVLALGVFGIVR
jgi:hypothetical protein